MIFSTFSQLSPPSQPEKRAHVGLTWHYTSNLGRQPNGQINRFGQVVGKVKGLFLHGKIEYLRGKRWRCFERKSGCGMNHYLTSGAVTTSVVVVAGAAGVRVLMFGIVCAAIGLCLSCFAARFARRFFVELGCVFGILTATSLCTVCREYKQAKRKK